MSSEPCWTRTWWRSHRPPFTPRRVGCSTPIRSPPSSPGDKSTPAVAVGRRDRCRHRRPTCRSNNDRRMTTVAATCEPEPGHHCPFPVTFRRPLRFMGCEAEARRHPALCRGPQAVPSYGSPCHADSVRPPRENAPDRSAPPVPGRERPDPGVESLDPRQPLAGHARRRQRSRLSRRRLRQLRVLRPRRRQRRGRLELPDHRRRSDGRRRRGRPHRLQYRELRAGGPDDRGPAGLEDAGWATR